MSDHSSTSETPNPTKGTHPSPFYRSIAGAIAAAFIIWSLFTALDRPETLHVVDSIAVTKNTTLSMQNELDLNGHQFYTIHPGVTLTAKLDPTEKYPTNYLDNGGRGWDIADDLGNTAYIRAGAESITIHNVSTQPLTLGIGRCMPGSTVDFSANTSGNTSSTPWKMLLKRLLIIVSIMFIFRLLIIVGINKLKPGIWVEPLFGDSEDEHHPSNGYNLGFFLFVIIAIVFGFFFHGAVADTSEPLMYALIPLVAFVYYTSLIDDFGKVVPKHIRKGVWNDDTQEEVYTASQGGVFVIDWVNNLGSFSDQGQQAINIDSLPKTITPQDPEDNKITLSDGPTVWVSGFGGWFKARSKDTDWLTNVDVDSIEDLWHKYVVREAWDIVSDILPEYSLPDMRKREKRTEACERIQRALQVIFDRDGVEIDVKRIDMSQPTFSQDMLAAMEIESVMKQYGDTVDKLFGTLSPKEKMDAAFALAGKAQQINVQGGANVLVKTK